MKRVICKFPSEYCNDTCCHDCDAYAECDRYGFSCQMTKEECEELNASEIMDFAMRRLICYGGADPDDMLKILGVEKPKKEEESAGSYADDWNLKRNLILTKYTEQPEHVMLMAAYIGFGDSSTNKFYQSRSWELKHKYEHNEKLDLLYDALTALGYEMSDEERQLREGTHELLEGC